MKNKIFALLAAVILIGVIVVATIGFNVDYCYKKHYVVSIEIGQEFNKSDIKAITDEIFPNEKVEIQSSGVYSDNLVLNVKKISKEQKESLSSKINEKYGTETTAESINVKFVPSYRLRDLAKSYALPMLITTAIILVYMIIRYKKVGIKKIVAQLIGLSALAEALYVSLIAITRFPVNRLVMPGAVTIYFVIVTFLACGYEKQIKVDKE